MILVFGGDGQLGCELVRTAKNWDISLTAVSRSAVDITDPLGVGATINDSKPRLVVNAAAYTNVDQAEKEVEAAERANALGPAIISAACASTGVPLIHISSDYVFDGKKVGAYVEDDRPAPINVYGRTKLDGETAVRRSLKHHVILRTSWLYGEFRHNFLKTIVRLAQDRDELRVVADQYGCPTSTRTLSAAILKMAPRVIAKEHVWGTYHFAGAGITTRHDFAAVIVATQSQLTGRSPKIVPISTAEFPTVAPRPQNSSMDCGLFKRVFGVQLRWWREEVEEITKLILLGQQPIMKNYVA